MPMLMNPSPDNELYQARSFLRIGHCIYCPNMDRKPLSDEHIVPYSLGGVDILRAASCTDCSKITSYLEGYCGRFVFNEYRYIAGSPSYRQRPSTLPIHVWRQAKASKLYLPHPISIPVEDYPHELSLPHLPLPGIINDLPPQASYSRSMQMSRWKFPGRVGEMYTPITPGPFRNEFKADVFARELAKIAHSAAVATHGLSKLNWLLPDIILGKQKDHLPYLIGSDQIAYRPSPNALHQIIFWLKRRKDDGLVVAQIRLYANLQSTNNIGTPIYVVAVATAPLS